MDKIMGMNDTVRDEGVVTINFGKISYGNPKRKANLAEVEFGFRKLNGNRESYYTTTGGIWNTRKTDYLVVGASVHETIQTYVHDETLQKLIDFGNKYHLMNKSKMPKKDVKWVENLIGELKDRFKVTFRNIP